MCVYIYIYIYICVLVQGVVKVRHRCLLSDAARREGTEAIARPPVGGSLQQISRPPPPPPVPRP